MKSLKIAILDMYNNAPNEGMRCILQLVRQAQKSSSVAISYDVFNVRANVELPGLDYDIYISSGGPGSPLPTDEPWEAPYFELLEGLLNWNNTSATKKHVLLICHSFQLMCRHLEVGVLSKRKSTSFGIFPLPKTEEGETDALLSNLPNPFFSIDSRDFQVTQPDQNRLAELGVKVLVLEKERPHVPLEQALMALRFTDEIVGTQFHPEADAEGMLRHLLTNEKRQQVIDNHGEAKYHDMVRLLQDPDAIELTNATIVPGFLQRAIAALTLVDAEIEHSA